MKKLKNKVKKTTKAPAKTSAMARPSTRITNDTVKEYREQVLAEGRKFKYPVQYSRHKLVINSILIGLVTVILLAIFIWWQLYPLQNTGKFFYRITQIAPVPVASVDGKSVRYSDYLMYFRSAEHYLEQNEPDSVNNKGADKQREYLKRESINRAIADTYAKKLAEQKGITASDQEVEDRIQKERGADKYKMSERAYESAVLEGFYGWSLDEYKGFLKNKLLKRKVVFSVDDEARQKAQDIEQKLQARGADFGKIAAEFSDDEMAPTNKGDVGFIKTDSQDKNGLVKAANSLNKGQISGVIEGSDALYIIKVTDKKGDEVRFSRIRIELNQFKRDLERLKKENKIDEFIDITQTSPKNSQA